MIVLYFLADLTIFEFNFILNLLSTIILVGENFSKPLILQFKIGSSLLSVLLEIKIASFLYLNR